MDASLAGQLLVASPSLADPNFRRTVVLIGVHNEDGAMGVILNRPSETMVAEAVPQLEAVVDSQEPVYVGGPVQPSSVVLLAEFLDPTPAALLVLGRIGFPAGATDVDGLAESTDRRRVYAGYAAADSLMRRSSKATGSPIPPCPTMSLRRCPSTSGRRSSSARAAAMRCLRACRWTRA